MLQKLDLTTTMMAKVHTLNSPSGKKIYDLSVDVKTET